MKQTKASTATRAVCSVVRLRQSLTLQWEICISCRSHQGITDSTASRRVLCSIYLKQSHTLLREIHITCRNHQGITASTATGQQCLQCNFVYRCICLMQSLILKREIHITCRNHQGITDSTATRALCSVGFFVCNPFFFSGKFKSIVVIARVLQQQQSQEQCYIVFV